MFTHLKIRTLIFLGKEAAAHTVLAAESFQQFEITIYKLRIKAKLVEAGNNSHV
jgi:hypothetical protein